MGSQESPVDWGALPKVDAHVHVTPADVIAANQDYDGAFVTHGGLEHCLGVMSANAIERAFVMPFNDPAMLSMDFTVETVNRNLAELANASGGRLSFFADVDPRRSLPEMLAELDRALADPGCVGIKVHATNTGYPLDGEYHLSLFRYASANDVLVEIHSYPREHLNDDVCSPSRILRVLREVPGLRVSVAHLGGWQYHDLAATGVYVNISAALTDMVSRVGTDGANEILRSFDIERLVFATDYPDNRVLRPEAIHQTYLSALSEMDFSEAEARLICWGNAARMTGLVR